MRDHDEDGIIGTRPPRTVDLGPLFAECEPAVAEAELERFLRPAPEVPVAPIAPAPRAREETQAFTAPEPLTVADIQRRRLQIERAVEQPLRDLAKARRNQGDRSKGAGVTAEDVRRLASERGLGNVLGDQQRAWSWLPKWLDTLTRVGHLVKWTVQGQPMRRTAANGNDQVIYLDPYDHRASGAA